MAKKKKGTLKDMVKAPRTIDIEGQLHMLAWITPKEGKTLKAMGGAGTKGPMGIPMYLEPDARSPGGSAYSGGSDPRGESNFSGGARSSSSVSGMEDEYDPFEGTGRTAAETLGYDTSSQVEGQDERPEAGISKEDYESMPFYMKSKYKLDDAGNILSSNVSEIERDPSGRVTGLYTQGDAPGLLGIAAKALGLGPFTTYTGFGAGQNLNQFRERGGSEDQRQAAPAAPTVAAVEEEDTPLSQALKDYYAKGVGTATQPTSDLASLISTTTQATPSPVGGRYDPETGLFYLPDGTVIDIRTGKRVQPKREPLTIKGLEMFKPVSV